MYLSFKKLKPFISLLSIDFTLTYLSGCASPAEVSMMTVDVDNKIQFASNSPYYKNLAVSSVAGSSETHPLWTSQVSSEDFKAALESSLNAAGLLNSNESPRYYLTARLITLDQPLVGANMTVRTTVDYAIEDKKLGQQVFDETVDASFTSTMSDAFMGVTRLKMANEGSIKRNITLFLNKLKKNPR